MTSKKKKHAAVYFKEEKLRRIEFDTFEEFERLENLPAGYGAFLHKHRADGRKCGYIFLDPDPVKKTDESQRSRAFYYIIETQEIFENREACARALGVDKRDLEYFLHMGTACNGKTVSICYVTDFIDVEEIRRLDKKRNVDGEYWVRFPGYGGAYHMSNLGRLKKEVKGKDGKPRGESHSNFIKIRERGEKGKEEIGYFLKDDDKNNWVPLSDMMRKALPLLRLKKLKEEGIE